MTKAASIPQKAMVSLMVVVMSILIGVMIMLGTILFWRNKDMVLNQFSDRVLDLEIRSNALESEFVGLRKMVESPDYGHTKSEFR